MRDKRIYDLALNVIMTMDDGERWDFYSTLDEKTAEEVTDALLKLSCDASDAFSVFMTMEDNRKAEHYDEEENHD